MIDISNINNIITYSQYFFHFSENSSALDSAPTLHKTLNKQGRKPVNFTSKLVLLKYKILLFLKSKKKGTYDYKVHMRLAKL